MVFDKSDITSLPTILYIRILGGEIGAVSSLAPKIGPLGLSPKKIGEQLCNATKSWEGLKVTCKLIVQNRQVDVEVVPSVSSFILKALKEPKRDKKKTKNIKHNGNISLKNIIAISKLTRNKSNSISIHGSIREVMGTARSIGCLVYKKT